MTSPEGLARTRTAMLIAVLALATASLSFMSSRHLSATFDEIILVAAA